MASKPASLKHRNLPLLMLQAREHLIGRFRPLLNAHGITEQQWRIVRVLLEVGALEPREIGELCRLSSPSLAGVLARMEEIGLVSRKRLAHDQRRVRVSLTPRSRVLAATSGLMLAASGVVGATLTGNVAVAVQLITYAVLLLLACARLSR